MCFFKKILYMFIYTYSFLLYSSDIPVEEMELLNESKPRESTSELDDILHDSFHIDNIGLQIHLDKGNDLFFESMWWHFKLEFRNFEIVIYPKCEVPHDKISLFSYQTQNRCIIILNDVLLSQDGLDTCESQFDGHIQWIFLLNNRQFLITQHPLSEIMGYVYEYNYVYIPTCCYLGFDHLSSREHSVLSNFIYRTDIDLEKPSVISKRLQNDLVHIIEKHLLYSVEYKELEEGVSDINDLIHDPLEIENAIIESIKTNFNCICRAPLNLDHDMLNIHRFSERYSMPYHFRFGHNYAYAMVPKNATSTVSLMLNSYEIQRLWKETESKDVLYYSFCHPFSFYRERYKQLLDPRVFKFTVVRNPYVRILSAYLDRLCTEKRRKFNRIFGFPEEDIISFESFLLSICVMPSEKLDVQFAPMWVLSMFPVIRYDAVIKMENFEEGAKFLLKKFSLTYKLSAYSYNNHSTGSSKKLSQYYNENCINLVKSIYENDFIYFDYSMEFPEDS